MSNHGGDVSFRSIIQSIYKYAITVSYVIYIVLLFGIYNVAPQYLQDLQTGIKYFVVIFLMLRFNPITWGTNYSIGGNKFDNFDRNLVFSAALFLFTTSILTSAVTEYFQREVKLKIGIPVEQQIVKPVKSFISTISA